MEFGGGVSTWSCLHRLQLFQMCSGSRCGDDSAWNGGGIQVHGGGSEVLSQCQRLLPFPCRPAPGARGRAEEW